MMERIAVMVLAVVNVRYEANHPYNSQPVTELRQNVRGKVETNFRVFYNLN